MNPGNENPEIPSLKPLGGKEDEKKGGGMVPSSAKPAPSSGFKFPGFGGGSTGSKAFSAPNLKVRGLGGGGATVMDRLKNLRKKDLIFIAAGLCTLGMAPLAEHLLMSPEEQTAKLEEGFNRQQGPLFNDGGTVYEPGNGVGSPGGLVGSGSDVITPLNVRDPSNLIMSPGAQKKADAVANAAPPPPTTAPGKGESDWKDVLRDSAKGGVSKAVQQSPKLPKPNVKMAGAIRGLSALGGGGGGTGASLKLDPLSASNVPNHAAGSNALTRSQATPGFRGVTSRSGTSSGAGEDLRAAGARQSDIFNKGGGASAALDAASREAIPTGGGSSGGAGGRPGEGGETKNPGGNSQKDNKSLGESLAFLRQKMEMEKSLDLKWERKKWNEFGRQKMMEESALKLGFDMFGKFAEKAFINPLADAVGQAVAGGGGPQVGWECNIDKLGTVKGTTASLASRYNITVSKGGLAYCGGGGNAGMGATCGSCKPAVVGGDDSGPAGTPTDRRDGSGVRAPGASQMAGRERRMSEASGKLKTERDNASALTEQIKGTCDGITGTTEPLKKVKANCLEFHAASTKLTKGLEGLYTASDEMKKAWGFLGTASGNMEAEQRKLNASVKDLGTAAEKLSAAEKALQVPAGTEELPKDLATKAQTEVEAARTALKTAKQSHEAAKGAVDASKAGIAQTNQALVDSAGRGAAADTALKAANTDITGVVVPKAADAAGTTIQLAPFEKDLTSAKERALANWREIRADHKTWTDGQKYGEQSRDALHGTAATSEEMKIDLEGGANAAVEKKGAMGTAYNNFGAYAVPLTAKQDPYQAAYKAGETAFKAAKQVCAAANTTPCAQAATDYNNAITNGLKAPQGDGTMPVQNKANQGAANKDLATAVGHVQSMVSSVQSAGQTTQQVAAAPPSSDSAAP